MFKFTWEISNSISTVYAVYTAESRFITPRGSRNFRRNSLNPFLRGYLHLHLAYLALPPVSRVGKLVSFLRTTIRTYLCVYVYVYICIFASRERRNACFPYFFPVRLAVRARAGMAQVKFLPPPLHFFILLRGMISREFRNCGGTYACHWQKLMRYLKAVKLPRKIVGPALFSCKFKHRWALLKRR